MAVGVDRSPAGAVDVHAVSSATARVKAPHLIIGIASSTLAGLLGFEDRDANSLSLDLQAGDATV
jgi:hypothetical protein